MSGRGGQHPGSGRRRISSKKECDRVWQRGHRRINLDNILFSSWVSSKLKCGYSSDSEFARHPYHSNGEEGHVSFATTPIGSSCPFRRACTLVRARDSAFLRGYSREEGLDRFYSTLGTGDTMVAHGFEDAEKRVLNESDPAWRAGGTTLQGYSEQQFMPADPIKVDPSRKVVLELRLVAREDETEVVFPEEEFKPLSTLHPPAVQE